MNKILVKCISERRSVPGQLTVDQLYIMDLDSLCECKIHDEYADIYLCNKDDVCIGTFETIHFIPCNKDSIKTIFENPTSYKTLEDVIIEFLNRYNMKDSFIYHFRFAEKTVYINTPLPFDWIGETDDKREELKHMLSEEIVTNCNVKFLYIRGKFVSIA